MDMFAALILEAKNGDMAATEKIIEMYEPLLISKSLVEGVFDEDLHQELVYTVVRAINGFKFS